MNDAPTIPNSIGQRTVDFGGGATPPPAQVKQQPDEKEGETDKEAEKSKPEKPVEKQAEKPTEPAVEKPTEPHTETEEERIERESFLAILNDESKLNEVLNMLFEKYDLNKDGGFDHAELKSLADECYSQIATKKLTDADINEVLEKLDRNKDNLLQRSEIRPFLINLLRVTAGLPIIPLKKIVEKAEEKPAVAEQELKETEKLGDAKPQEEVKTQDEAEKSTEPAVEK